jgi:hypothetical protein
MPQFRLSKYRRDSKSNHDLHKESCPHFQSLKSFIDLGNFIFCTTAVRLAKTIGYEQVECCQECCDNCNSN